MSREYGYNTQVLGKRESSYGVDPSGNYIQFPFDSFNLGGSRDLIKSGQAGVGRDPREIFQDAEVVDGDASLPLDMRYIGYFLTGLLGNPSTSGSTTYTHTFTSDGETLPSYAFEVGYPNAGEYDLNLGVKVDSMSFDIPRVGPAKVNVGLIGQSETQNSSTQGGTPTSHTLARASNLQATVKENSTVIANLNSANFTYSNNLERIETIGQTKGRIEGLDPGGNTSCNGTMNVRFADTSFFDDAVAGTPLDLEFAWTISASLKLVITIHEAYVRQTKKAIDGPGGVNADLSFEGLYNSSNSAMMTAVLTNDLAGTTYTS